MLNHVEEGRAALDVDRSLRGRRWRPRLDIAAERQALAITQMHGLPDLLARIVAGRSQTASTCLSFLAPRLQDLMPDPHRLGGMEDAVDRLRRAAQAGEAVAVFGDYDVDGACAAALLAGYLRAAGCAAAVHIPDRLTEGYGPNEGAIDALRRTGATLLVTVDCGTTSLVPLAHARAIGFDVLVLDHHQAGPALPAAAAVVNPNRLDDLSGLGHLCAAGVVFMTLVALHRALRRAGFWDGRPAPDLLEGLDLVALATVADVVPLVGLNRAFVAKGLAVMRQRRRPGLAALADVAGTGGPPTAFHLGFLLGPRINAGGRIGDAGLGARLLLTDDPLESRRIAERLDTLNRERRAIEADALEEADAAALRRLLADGETPPALVTAAEGWHPGVVGLVAARLRERYDRPAFAVALQGDTGTGSGRSVPGVDLGRIVREAVEAGLLVKGGGHAMAAGITLHRSALPAFEAFLRAACAAAAGEAAPGPPTLALDGVLAAAALDGDTVALVERAGPFGSGNPEPLFALPAQRLVAVQPAGADHLRLALRGAEGRPLAAIAFRAAGSAFGAALKAAEGRPVHVAGHLALSRWGGGGTVEMRLVDAALAMPAPASDRAA